SLFVSRMGPSPSASFGTNTIGGRETGVVKLSEVTSVMTTRRSVGSVSPTWAGCVARYSTYEFQPSARRISIPRTRPAAGAPSSAACNVRLLFRFTHLSRRELRSPLGPSSRRDESQPVDISDVSEICLPPVAAHSRARTDASRSWPTEREWRKELI